MGRRCPACDRTWDGAAVYCGACGARLDALADTSAPPPPRRGRAWLVAAVAGVVAIGAAIAVPRVDLPAVGGDDLADDDITLPSEVPDRSAGEGAERPGPDDPIACTREGRPVVDCVRWRAGVGTGGVLALHGAPLVLFPTEEGLVARGRDDGAVVWRRDDLVGTWFPLAATPAVVVLAARDGEVAALDTATGETRWMRPSAVVRGPRPQVGDGPVLVGTTSGPGVVDGLAAVAAGDGSELWAWSAPWGREIRSTTRIGDAVFVSAEGRLARLDATTGTLDWDVASSGEFVTEANDDHVVVQAFGDQSGNEAALMVHDARTGEVVTERTVGTVVDQRLVGDVLVLVDHAEAALVGLELPSGEVAWRREDPVELRLGVSPDGPTEALVVHDRSRGTLRRTDPATGEHLWVARVPTAPITPGTSAFLGQPLLLDGRVLVEDGSSVATVFDVADGSELVSIDGGGGMDVRVLDPLLVVRGGEVLAPRVPRPAGDP